MSGEFNNAGIPKDGVSLGTIDLSADGQCTEVPNCHLLDRVWFDVTYTDADSPVGTFTVESSIDGSNWDDVELTSDMIHGLAGDATLASDGGIDIDGTAAGSFRIAVKDTPNHLRIAFEDTGAAGSGDTATVHCWGK